jgi:hypothetical protein
MLIFRYLYRRGPVFESLGRTGANLSKCATRNLIHRPARTLSTQQLQLTHEEHKRYLNSNYSLAKTDDLEARLCEELDLLHAPAPFRADRHNNM